MYDLIIIGGGPAGITAGIYAHRYKLNCAVISDVYGGLVNTAHLVDNYPGMPEMSGMDMMKAWKDHAEKMGVQLKQTSVKDISKNEDNTFKITTGNEEIQTKCIILALGTQQKKLNIPGEDQFSGKGVSYCYTCDAPLFSGRDVVVAGCSNSAAYAALLLTEYANKVYLVFEKETMDADPSKVDEVNANDKIELVPSKTVKEIKGDMMVSSVVLNDDSELKVDGIFVEMGKVPSTVFTQKLGVEMDAQHFIKVNDKQETNIENIYAAGDITTSSGGLRQIITASSEGAIAAFTAFKKIRSGQ
jgi:thioredoxin reductase (NADPH)